MAERFTYAVVNLEHPNLLRVAELSANATSQFAFGLRQGGRVRMAVGGDKVMRGRGVTKNAGSRN